VTSTSEDGRSLPAETRAEGPEFAARLHTAEHLLTAVMRLEFGSSGILESHFGAKKVKCDYAVDRPLGEVEIVRIEAAVNREIAANRPVRAAEMARAEAGKMVDLSRTPPEADPVRIVEIVGFDRTACAAEHVTTTGEIGRFVIRSYEKRDPTVVRLRFTLDPAARGEEPPLGSR
jgi:misacylated tRNA(Ala) deacylase